MWRLCIRAVVLLGVILGFTFGTALPITDPGDPAITRLWNMGEDEFTCSATFVKEAQGLSWLVTAGHCATASNVEARNSDRGIWAWVNWRMVVQGRPEIQKVYDVAVGTAPDTREVRTYRPLADRMPTEGQVYIHGFPLGVERIVAAGVLGPSALMPGSVEIVTFAREILPGSSGSPVLNARGAVVGVVWGLREDPAMAARGFDVVLVTPVEVIHALFKLLAL